MTIDQFVGRLKGAVSSACWANPWLDWVPELDVGPEAPGWRAQHLAAYLGARLDSARLLMIAEAPGYQGARFSGIAMTCERTLLGGKVGIPKARVFDAQVERWRTSNPTAGRNEAERRQGFCEPTATIVWGELAGRDGAAFGTVLWNVFPYHPHKAGAPLTNRTPSDEEVSSNMEVLEQLLELFPGRAVVTIGDTSRRHLERLGIKVAASVRHPANGGAPAFRSGIDQILTEFGFTKLVTQPRLWD